MSENGEKLGLTGRIVDRFLGSNLSVLLLIASLAAGFVALAITPREENPQIAVPMADIIVQMPGSTPQEVENLVTNNLEQRLWGMEGVKHIYSVSMPGQAMVTVRFKVGWDRTRALVEIYNKIQSNIDKVPPGVTGWIVKPVGINDVPIVTLTLYSSTESDYQMRLIAEEILHHLRQVPNTGKSFIVGGRARQIRVMLEPDRLAAHDLTPLQVAHALRGADVNLKVGTFTRGNQVYVVDSGPFLSSVAEVRNLVVGVRRDRPVYLRDVARVFEGPAEATDYVRLSFGPAAHYLTHEPGQLKNTTVGKRGKMYSAVTIAIAKRQGTNAVSVAEEILHKVEELKGVAIPSNVHVLVTRNYGETANEKVNELVRELLFAVGIIVVLLAFSLGMREALIVAIAVPVTLAVTLVGNLLAGYSINRVTLFALILSLGLLVDDPIVDVENIHRHFRMRKHPPREATLIAVNEVRPPTIVATFAVILSFIPMLFVTGMMGPYMRPMPYNVPLAMLMSLVVAFTITPWACFHLLRREYDRPAAKDEPEEGASVRRWYRRILEPLLDSPRRGRLFLAGVVAALIGSILLVAFGLVPVKMLPFDNKNELQLVVNMPQGTPAADTNKVLGDLAAYLTRESEVTAVQTYAGTAAPFGFNGMVRHYYMRRWPWQGQVRIQLAPKQDREEGSHEFALRIRPAVEKIGREDGARVVDIVETPPGPPVLASIVAELHGPPGAEYSQMIAYGRKLKDLLAHTGGLAEADYSGISRQPRLEFMLDRQKAALNGISTEQAARTLAIVLGGDAVVPVHTNTERTPLMVELRMPRADRSSIGRLLASIKLRGTGGAMVPLSELGTVKRTVAQQPIYHKDLRRVVFVTADAVGISPVNEVLWLEEHTAHMFPPGYTINWSGEGEWHVTVTVFRDLGIAFGAALFFIFVLLVAQTESMAIALIIMAAIPLTMIGIMPGFFVLNLLTEGHIAGYADPTFFTATAMIGMIALAGIVVRNSIILIDFIHHGVARGLALKEAVLEAGAVRLRPIVLTAGAAALGSAVITFSPIFSGLAWAFIFGIFASTAFTLVVIPLIYYMAYRNAPVPAHASEPDDGEESQQ